MTAVRTIKLGLYGGLVIGLAQDAARAARGQRLEYIDYITGKYHQYTQGENRIT